jgi:hypothetical protein
MYLLLIVMFTGQVHIYEYPNAADCESGLIQKTDVGNYKKIKTAVCVNTEKEVE